MMIVSQPKRLLASVFHEAAGMAVWVAEGR
jgi:hypothetical protein